MQLVNLVRLQQPAQDQTVSDGLQTVWQTFREMGGFLLERLPYIGVGVVVFFLFLFASRLVRSLIRRFATRIHALDETLADLLGKIAGAITVILGFFAAAVAIFPAFKPGDLIAGLGITSVAIGFAFKDILQNFFAGILILLRRPFKVGDQIRVKEFEGTVEEINTRSTRLKTYDGERAILPNGDVYTSAILVRTAYDRRRVKMVIGIGYEDAIEEARQVIRQVVESTGGVLPEPGPWIYVSELAPSSVNLTVYFWVESHQANLLKVSDNVMTGIKLALDKASIDMPYPHTVLLMKSSVDDSGEKDAPAGSSRQDNHRQNGQNR
ncbi:mechanosensitive ion channel family protein [Nibrella saemangeumensis]|uniref:Mechanosensitive ion channel family protein n=1 Tax=Nibrella saemangeumensis TaxID=1084526 RepID=A0ABP8MSY8_9BACT